MKRLSVVLALFLFLIPTSCNSPVTETEIQGPEVPAPSFAPRSGEIVYTAGTASANDLFLKDLGANTVTNLTGPTSGQNQMPEWSPSGDSIVFSALSGTTGVRELRIMSQSGGSFSTPQAFLDPCPYPFWGPGTGGNPDGSQSFPAWSSDGKHIAFICASGLAGRGQLWVASLVPVPGGTAWALQVITNPDLLVSRPVWWKDPEPNPDPTLAKDGKIIATVLNGNGEGGFQRDIMWFDVPWNGLPGFAFPGGGPARGPITDTPGADEDNPAWTYMTGVGNVIAYTQISNLGAVSSSGTLLETSDICRYTMTLDAAGDPVPTDPTLSPSWKQLTHSGSADYPSWTPDGNAILFVQKNGNGVFSVFKMPQNGVPLTNLVNTTSGTLSLWAKMRP